MNWPPPNRQDHEKFCTGEGWNRVRDARGRTGTHHVTYELRLPDGRVLRTQPTEAFPVELVHLLLTRVGLSEADVAAMTRAQAVERLDRYWTEGS